MIKKGDTLIEVTLAIGIFSMVAVSVVAVMSNGTAGAETALETTLTRQEIDAQADALRFIHSAYISDQNLEDDRYSKLWKSITENALDLYKDSSGGERSDESRNKIITFSPTTCDSLYTGDEDDVISTLGAQNAFVINTNYLGNYSNLKLNNSEESLSNEINKTVVSYNKNNSDKFGIAETYPHLVYQRENGPSEDEDSLVDNDYDVLKSAEGIYVIAVKDSGSIVAGENAFTTTSAFYDFYIRSCWYGVGDEFPSTISTVIRLYNPDAIVERKPKSKDELVYMQDATTKKLEAKMPKDGDSIKLVDNRDNKTYRITRIGGQYWMTQNLQFVGAKLDPASSNVGTATTISYGNLTSGDSYDQARINIGVDSNGDPTVWYNYAAASAMAITGNSNESDAVYDICPKGWRLPTEAEFTAIRRNKDAFNPVGGGWYQQGILRVPYFGYWWSSTKVNGNSRYRMTGNSTWGLSVDYNGTRTDGYYVRCIKKGGQEAPQPTQNDPTMQTITKAELAAKMPNNGDSITLKDKRDDKEYSVARINDVYWMTKNLAIGCAGSGSTYSSTISSKELTSDNSNLATTWTTPTVDLTSGDSYDEARMACDSTHGGYYNYVAATAGAVSGTAHIGDAIMDICPKGWRLPNLSEISNDALYGSSSIFLPAYSGIYNGGTHIDAGRSGLWWSSTPVRQVPARAISSRGALTYADGKIDMNPWVDRQIGATIRCVKKDD